MKKTRLLIMPVVIMMAACNNTAPGYSTKVDLPAGGEEVKYSESDTKACDDALGLLSGGVFSFLNHDAIKLSLNLNGEAKNIPVYEENKINVSAKAELDAYVVMPKEEVYASAFVDVKNLSLTVSGIPEIGTIGIDGLKLKAYYRVETTEEETTVAKVYGDLSDPSVKANVVPALQTVVDYFLSIYTDPSQEQIQIDVDQMYDTFFKDGKVVYTLPEFTVPDTEETYPDPFGYYLSMGNVALSFASLMVKIDSSVLNTLTGLNTTLKVYKDNAGEPNRVGFAVEGDFLEYIKKMIPAESTLEGEEEPVEPSVSLDDFDKIKAGAALVCGTTTGSKEFAIESLAARADIAMKNGLTAQGEVNLGAFYDSQAAFTPLTDAEAAQYTVDINAIIALIQMIIDGASQGGETR